MYEASFHYVTCIFTYYIVILYAAEWPVSMSTHVDHKCSVLCTLLFGGGKCGSVPLRYCFLQAGPGVAPCAEG